MSKKPVSELSDKEMAEALELKKQERITRCGQRIQAILAEENCDLSAEVILRSGQVIPNILVISK